MKCRDLESLANHCKHTRTYALRQSKDKSIPNKYNHRGRETSQKMKQDGVRLKCGDLESLANHFKQIRTYALRHSKDDSIPSTPDEQGRQTSDKIKQVGVRLKRGELEYMAANHFKHTRTYALRHSKDDSIPNTPDEQGRRLTK